MPIQPVITGNPVISTAQSKFGGSSFLQGQNTNGVLDYSNKGLIFYSEFTLEFFFRTVGATVLMSSPDVFSISISRPSSYYVNLSFFDSVPSTIFSLGNLVTISTSTWYHIAITRSIDNFYRVFQNGIKIYEIQSTKLVNPSGVFKIGATTQNGYNFDELRFKNECVYTQNFSVPVSPFQTDLKTLLLLHFDGLSGSKVFIDSSDIGVCDTPAASVPSGIYSGPFYVALSCITPDSLIYYRINSGEWIQGSLVNIQNSCTVQVKSVRIGLQDSDILTLNYTVKCSAPVFNLDSGFYAAAIQVVLSNNNNHQIFYKINSGDWIQGNSILVDNACVLYAKCSDTGFNDSEIISRVFNFMSAGSSGGGEVDFAPLVDVLTDMSTKITVMNDNLNTIAGIAVPSVPE
jgi:hypothetical protein